MELNIEVDPIRVKTGKSNAAPRQAADDSFN